MAAGYTAALATMPTLAELAANHVVHGALAATNFFGINAIPIALNEFQYVQMWIQAAVTMALYQAQATAVGALTSLQNSPAVPPILKNFLAGISNDTVAHDPTVDNPVDTFVSNILQNFGIHWNPAEGTLNGLDYDSYVDPGQPMFWVARTLELGEDFQQFGVYLQTNPVLAFQYLVSLELFDWPTHIAEIVPYLASQPAALAAALGAAVAPVGGVGGIAGLAGLAGIQPAVVPAPAAVVAAPSLLPVVGSAPTFAAPAGAPASAPAPAPTPATSTVAGSVAPPASPAAGATGFGFPYVVGGPGVGSGSGMSSSAGAGAKRKAPEPDTAAVAAAVASREAARARRRQRTRQHGYGDEFMDMNVDVDPEWGGRPGAEMVASDQGAGNLGFAGTAPSETVTRAAGFTTLAADEFGSGPRRPMVPGTWDREGAYD